MYMISFRTKLGEVSKPYASLQEAVKIARRQAALIPKVRIYVHKVGARVPTCAGSYLEFVVRRGY